MPISRSIPLSKAWYGLIFLASMLPAIIIAPWLAEHAQQILLERALLKAEVYHKQVEAYLSLETERLMSVLQNKADPIAHFANNPQQAALAKKLLQRIITRERIFNTVSIYDLNALPQETVTRDNHTPAPMTNTSTAFVIAKHGRTFIGSPELLLDKHFELLMAVPLELDGQVVGVLVATVNILEFWQGIQHRVAQPEGINIYLIDGRGILLAHEQDSKRHQGDLLTDKAITRTLLSAKNWHQTTTYTGFEGDEVFGIGSHISNLSWSLISEIPAKLINKPIEKALAFLVFIVLMVHVAFGLLGALMVRRMVKPLHQLRQAMKHVAVGDYQAKLPQSSYTELQDVIQHFTHMTNTIKARESSLRQLLRAIEHLGESIIIIDRDGILRYVNPAFQTMTQYDDSIINQPVVQLYHNDERDLACYYLLQCLKQGTAWEGRATALRKDGSSFPVLLHISPVLTGKEITHFVAILQDISEYDRLEKQLFHAQKMESIGTLVGGIAHDFNNNLAAIMGNTYLAKNSAKAGDWENTVQKIETIEALSKHAAQVVAQLMAYARQDIVQHEAVLLNTLVDDTLRLSNALIPENINFTTHISDDALWVSADKTQAQQMLVNLLNNARDAVADVKQPEIRLVLEAVEVDQAFCQQHPDISSKHFARLRVQDNGIGIDKKHLAHIFDPFFTTKSVGEGTGLGLSMLIGMVQSHRGAVEVQSELGKGTTFDVYLPLIKQPQAKRKNTETPSDTSSASAVVLLIDDDAEVRNTTAEVLKTFGFQVIQAEDGEAGLACYRQQPHIDVIISDMVMPNMGGLLFAEHIRKQNQDIGIIFLTGYHDELSATHQHLQPFTMLGKPIDFDALKQAIDAML